MMKRAMFVTVVTLVSFSFMFNAAAANETELPKACRGSQEVGGWVEIPPLTCSEGQTSRSGASKSAPAKQPAPAPSDDLEMLGRALLSLLGL